MPTFLIFLCILPIIGAGYCIGMIKGWNLGYKDGKDIGYGLGWSASEHSRRDNRGRFKR